MYTDFYGLIREPFRTTPDADSLFFSPSHREALGSILYGVKERKGIVVVTGEVGVGKTTILRRYLQIAATAKQKTVHLYNPNITFERLLATILNQLGAEPVSDENAEMVHQLHELSVAEHRGGGTVVLVIDEAQCMPVETLEGIRMLSNLETSNEKLIQIVLMGQPELETLLERHELRHVRERIAVHGRILPLTKSESFSYIQHRIEQVSREQHAIFSSAALALIVKTAQGIPRRLNILCDNALITGFRHRAPMISRKIAKQAIAEIDGSRAPVLWKSRAAVALVAALIVALPVLLYLGFGMDMPWWRSQIGLPDRHPSGQKSVGENVTLWTGTPIGPDAPVNAGPVSSPDQPIPDDLRKEPVLANPGKAGDDLGKEPASTGSAKGDEKVLTKPPLSTVILTEEKAELSERARLLAVLLDSGRVVLGRAQPAINNPRLEDKGFSSSVFETRLRKEFLTRTGHDLRRLAPAPMSVRAKVLLLR